MNFSNGDVKMIKILTIMKLLIWEIYGMNINQPQPKIIGGQQCSVEDNPFAVSIRTTTALTHFCGGSLIKPQWVLTAAHCTFEFMGEPERITCLIGLSEYQRSKVQSIAAQQIYIHEYYTFPAIYHDISIIQLERPAILFDMVGLISLPKKSKDIGCSIGKLTGWGSMRAWDPDKNLKPKSEMSSHLMCVDVDVMNAEDCKRQSHGRANELVLCTLIGNESKDACQGDSGGALFCENTQIGIISSGKGCGVYRNIAYYTNLQRYVNYIENIVSGSKARMVNFLIITFQIVFYCWLFRK